MLVIQDNSVYDSAHLLESDVSGQKVQMQLVTVKQDTGNTILWTMSWANDGNLRAVEKTKHGFSENKKRMVTCSMILGQQVRLGDYDYEPTPSHSGQV